MSFNTVEQLLTGYEGLLRFIKTTSQSFELARVKNGFLGKDAAFRDIKVNVGYHSENDPENQMSMICEVQLILNQYLHEKKRIHKLYSILREETYFQMVVSERTGDGRTKGLKNLKFEPILSVKNDIELTYDGNYFNKCCMNSELGLLVLNCGHTSKLRTIYCVDVASKSVIFEQESRRHHNHHWIVIKDQHYLCLQTSNSSSCSTLSMYRFKRADKSFQEDFSPEIQVAGLIPFCEFDKKFENIFILKDYEVLEKRNITDANTVITSINLDEKVTHSYLRQMTLSDDGSVCAIGGGANSYFYLIHLETKSQHKLSSKVMEKTFCPCFINGDTDYVGIGGYYTNDVEIWDVKKKEAFKVLLVGENVCCMTSTNNILAVAATQGDLQLWDVKKWEKFFSFKFEGLPPTSLHLTSDSKYLTVAGREGGDKCVVLELK